MEEPRQNQVRRLRGVLCSVAGLAVALSNNLTVPPARASIYNTKPYGEPYELEGTRMCFTTWYWVKPGRFDWEDNDGKSVFANRSVMARELDPNTHWKEYDLPRGVKLVCEKAEKGPFPIRPEYPWEESGIEITVTTAVMKMVLPMRLPIRLPMVAPPAADMPRSPVNRRPTHRKYCTMAG